MNETVYSKQETMGFVLAVDIGAIAIVLWHAKNNISILPHNLIQNYLNIIVL